MRRTLGSAVALACVISAPVALAQPASQIDALSAPRLPAPFVLPELSHPFPTASLASTLGGVGGNRSAGGASIVVSSLVRANAEASIVLRRRLYVGATWAFGAGLPPDGTGGTSSALGNAEPYVRIVFPMPSLLAFGFVLGATLPTATFDRNGSTASAMIGATSMEPTDLVQFLPGRWSIRPAADARALLGPFVLQIRQGFDVIIDQAGIESVRTAARVLVHAGLLVSRDVELSVEASQLYAFFRDEAAGVTDQRRRALTLGPSARFVLSDDLELGVGLSTSFFDTASRALDGFVAGRLSLCVHLP